MALGFNNGAPHESDVTKFVNEIGDYLEVYFVQLLRFIHENVQIEGIKAFHIIGFLRHSNRFGVRIKTRTGTKFTSYSRGKKWASTHWAGMTLILDALFGLGIINMIEKNIPASLCSAKGVIDEYRNRWGVEVFFKEEKSYWYLNKLPRRKINVAKCTIDFNFIAYNLISIFKKTLSEKYQNVGIKVLRREVLRKNAIMYFNEDGFELEFNVKKTKEKYHEHIESINSFVAKMREKRDIRDAICLSH